jgi:hypothetical protein
MKVSGEGYVRFAEDSPIFIRFLSYRRQRRAIFSLTPTPEDREGRPKSFHQSGDGILLTLTALTDYENQEMFWLPSACPTLITIRSAADSSRQSAKWLPEKE